MLPILAHLGQHKKKGVCRTHFDSLVIDQSKPNCLENGLCHDEHIL